MKDQNLGLEHINREFDMKNKLLLFLVGLVCLIGCVFLLSRSPAWTHLGFLDFLAMIGAGLSLAMLVMVVVVSTRPKPRPPNSAG
jgi:hypothetical protein